MNDSTLFVGNKMTRYEVAACLFFGMLAYRICLLPSFLASIANESMVYALVIGFVLDSILAYLCLEVARKGGLAALPAPAWARRILAIAVGAVCLLKVAVRVAETVTYCTGELFDEAFALPLAVILLLCVAFLSVRGFRGIGRTALVCSGVAALLLVLTFVFSAYSGYSFNLWVLLRPASVGKAFWSSMLWVGDGIFFLFVDTSDTVHCLRDYRPARLSLVAAWAVLVVFCFLMVYTYGSAVADVRYAFSRLFVSRNPESLGAVDWPVLLLWILSALVHMGNLFYASCEGLRFAPAPNGKRGVLPTVLAFFLALGGYLLLAKDKDALTDLSKTLWANIVLFAVILSAVSACCIVWLWHKKRAQRGVAI